MPKLESFLPEKTENRQKAIEKKNKEAEKILQAEKVYSSGLATVKDILSPATLKVESGFVKVGDRFARTYFVIAYPRYLQTGWFTPIINLDKAFDISMFIYPIDTSIILRALRKTATQVQSRMDLESESGKIRDPMLETSINDIEDLRDRLQQGLERFFKYGLYITVYGRDEKELDDLCSSLESVLEAKLIYMKPAVFRMEQEIGRASCRERV